MAGRPRLLSVGKGRSPAQSKWIFRVYWIQDGGRYPDGNLDSQTRPITTSAASARGCCPAKTSLKPAKVGDPPVVKGWWQRRTGGSGVRSPVNLELGG